MTSRAEYRLLLRHDNADIRLTKKGYEIGLASTARFRRLEQKVQAIYSALEALKRTTIGPTPDVQLFLATIGAAPLRTGISLFDLMKRPNITYQVISSRFGLPLLSDEVQAQIDITIKYDGYIKKQSEQVQRSLNFESKGISIDLDYSQISGLSNEARQKLALTRPTSIGQASRISGVSPADISLLLIYVEQLRRRNHEQST